MTVEAAILTRIEGALRQAGALLLELSAGPLEVEEKAPSHPVTEADRRADDLLRELLPRGDEGWLSEETVDDAVRLGRRRVWVVDPLDGTKELLAGVPEWCVSVALVEDGEPVAGGIFNPVRDEMVLGARGHGVRANGRSTRVTGRARLAGAHVLASRSEVRRGEWRDFASAGCAIEPTGSVAYKLALVAAGRADATWTLCPKNEWDVAGGAALVLAAGGRVTLPDGSEPRFNRPHPLLPGFVAAGPALAGAILPLLTSGIQHAAPAVSR